MIGLFAFIYFAFIAGFRLNNWRKLVVKSEKTGTYEFNHRIFKRFKK